MHKHKPESMFCLVQLTARGYLWRGWRLPPRAPPPGQGLFVNEPGRKLETASLCQ